MANNNMLQLCRLCLVKDDVNIPIFEDQGDIRQIFLKISSCLPVKVARDDRLPKKICDGCSYKLDMLYEFWNTSANAEKQLLSWLGEAGVPSKMADGTLTAVAQQMKPAEAFVKEETLEPPDGHADDDDKDYLFEQQKVEESTSAGPSATVTSNDDEEPPPKRARRTAAVKAAIAMDQDSDDDDDSGEPLTKIEDESEDSEGDEDDHVPAFVDVPSTSADDQPGPSGVGKDGVEAPSNSQGRFKELKVVFTDLKHDHTLRFDGEKYVKVDRKKQHTCYLCMEKFCTIPELNTHKLQHQESDAEDDLFEEDYPASSSPQNPPAIEDKVRNLDVLLKTQVRKTVSPPPEPKQEKKDTKSPFRCDTCNVCFESSDEAKTHQPKASTKCKFACSLCKRKFNTLYAFVVHVMQHKNNVSKNKTSSKSLYTCGYCGKLFDDCFQLKRHEIISHKKKRGGKELGEEVEEEKAREFTCELCYDVFTTEKALESHTEFHRQLEQCSEPVVYDEDEAATEVIVEDHLAAYDRSTTLQKATTSTGFVKLNTNNYVRDKFSLAVAAPQQAKQKITDKIKELMSTKPSKSILLPAPEPLGKARPKTCRPVSSTALEEAPVEVQKTGPTTFSIVYKDPAAAGSSHSVSNSFPCVLNPSLPAFATTQGVGTATTSGLPNGAAVGGYFIDPVMGGAVLAPTPQAQCNGTADGPQYAYVIIPSNPSGNVLAPFVQEAHANAFTTTQPIETPADDVSLPILTPKPRDPAPEPILIEDSDSSDEAPADEGNLVIDENGPEVGDAPSVVRKGFITVKKLKDLVSVDKEKPTTMKSSRFTSPSRCVECNTFFSKMRAWRNHEKKRVSCKLCDFKSCRKKRMQEHWFDEHGKKFCCRCVHFSENDDDFLKHLQTHAGRSKTSQKNSNDTPKLATSQISGDK